MDLHPAMTRSDINLHRRRVCKGTSKPDKMKSMMVNRLLPWPKKVAVTKRVCIWCEIAPTALRRRLAYFLGWFPHGTFLTSKEIIKPYRSFDFGMSNLEEISFGRDNILVRFLGSKKRYVTSRNTDMKVVATSIGNLWFRFEILLPVVDRIISLLRSLRKNLSATTNR